MQKYLLLLLMCLVGMIEAQAGIKYEKIASGSYVLTFSNSSDATYSWSSLPNEVKTATSVTIVTKDGYKLTTNDMEKLMGNDETVSGSSVSSVFANSLQKLDMSEAELTNYNDLKFMRTASNGNYGLNKLKYFEFPKNTTVIPDAMFHNNHSIEEVVMWENDDTNLSLFETIPNNCFQCCSKLRSVRIPEGVKYIGNNAFGGTETEPAPIIDAIHLPNTLETIGENAFAYNSVLTSIIIPANVTAIGKSAFQYNNNLEDVYVLGNHVITCDGAFNEEFTYDGFNYNNRNDGNSSVVTINDWKSNKNYVKHPLRLHIPKDSEAYKYCVNPYLRALNDLTEQELKNANSSAVKAKLVSYGIPDYKAYLFAEQKNWVVMDGYRLFNKGNEVHNSEYGGWRNFMLVACDVEKKTWHDGRLIESRWYSAVFPFSMSYNQLMSTYGVGTDVREFSYVNQHESADGQIIRTVTFLKEPAMPAGGKNAEGYVVKGRPYMIHPGVRSVPVNPSTRSASNEPVYRTIAGVDVSAANGEIASGANLETVTGDLVNGNVKGPKPQLIDEKAYTFKGTYKDTDVPAYTFFLGIKNGDLSTLGFYVTRVELKGKWKEFTAVVRKTDDSSNSYAKSMDLGFTDIIEDNLGITTAVENAVVNESSKNNGVVYNLSGQAVRENNASLEGLSKGVYVVNGKKIVVR